MNEPVAVEWTNNRLSIPEIKGPHAHIQKFCVCVLSDVLGEDNMVMSIFKCETSLSLFFCFVSGHGWTFIN